MVWNRPNINTDEDARLVHDGLVLKWARLCDIIKETNDKELVRSYAQDLIRVIELLRSMEELDF